jgi:putative FmdB family regulatory protein
MIDSEVEPVPLYEFACRKCEHTFEELVFGDEPVVCAKCASARLERLISVPARPQSTASADPPMACNSDGPPCGPQCSRF